MKKDMPPKVPKLVAMVSSDGLKIGQAIPSVATPLYHFPFDMNNPDHMVYVGQIAEAINKFVGEDNES